MVIEPSHSRSEAYYVQSSSLSNKQNQKPVYKPSINLSKMPNHYTKEREHVASDSKKLIYIRRLKH